MHLYTDYSTLKMEDTSITLKNKFTFHTLKHTDVSDVFHTLKSESRENLMVSGHGTLHFGTLHFAILERHVWASIEGERVL